MNDFDRKSEYGRSSKDLLPQKMRGGVNALPSLHSDHPGVLDVLHQPVAARLLDEIEIVVSRKVIGAGRTDAERMPKI
jgi:hypothetical protein